LAVQLAALNMWPGTPNSSGFMEKYYTEI